VKKQECLDQLRASLAGLPERDVEERIAFYNEMIDDRIEEGRAEEEAVAEIGSVEEIAKQIIAETPLVKIAKEKIRPKRRLEAWEIVLLILGAPVWLPLVLAVLAVLLSLYAALWSVVVSLWAVFGALAGCALGGIVGGIAITCAGELFAGLVLVGAGMICSGLAILTFFGCSGATKGTALLAAKAVLGIKKSFVGKEKGHE